MGRELAEYQESNSDADLTHSNSQEFAAGWSVCFKKSDHQHCGQETLLIRFTFETGPHPLCPSLMCVWFL